MRGVGCGSGIRRPGVVVLTGSGRGDIIGMKYPPG